MKEFPKSHPVNMPPQSLRLNEWYGVHNIQKCIDLRFLMLRDHIHSDKKVITTLALTLETKILSNGRLARNVRLVARD